MKKIYEKKSSIQFITSVILTLLINSVCTATESKDYALMGQALFSAFMCTALAAKINDTQEQQRLFMYGYNTGKQFLDAFETKKINPEDANSEVPVGVLWYLQGPTPDFMLGRIYESAQDEALKDVFKTNGTFNSDEIQERNAVNKFHELNCQLIGR